MTAALLGIMLGLAIGAGCRWFDVPVPAAGQFEFVEAAVRNHSDCPGRDSP